MTSTDSISAGGSEGNVRLFVPQTDIEAVSGILTFNPGETEKSLVLKINGDNIAEDNETFRLMIQGNDENSHALPSEASK